MLRTRERLGTPDEKRDLNREVFTIVAPRYDTLTRPLSLWRDAAWKKQLVASLPTLDAPTCVDLACGTGDLTGMLAHRYSRARIIGIDLTPRMLELARARCTGPTVEFLERDMCRTGLPDDSADIVTGGYALRNAPDLASVLRETHRILKPGGTAAFLDFSKPENRLLQNLELAVLEPWSCFWGWLLYGDARVCGYIADSLRQHPDRRAVRALMQEHGLKVTYSRRFYAGILELLVVRKGSTAPEKEPAAVCH